MTFRYARHTTDLDKIEKFYTTITGLQNLGGFKDHDGYDGIFLGYPDLDWHLEFTTSPHTPNRDFDEDDALVFYVNTLLEYTKIRENLQLNNIILQTPKNPYWVMNGIMINDPDGHNVIFSVIRKELRSTDPLTNLVKEKNIHAWSALVDWVRHLPYGRNANREDLSLVVKENKGTCSSKHAFLKKIADLNQVKNVDLVLGMYRMNHLNTLKIGNTILDAGLEYIPEAHCYLKLNNTRFDITLPGSGIDNLSEDIIKEIHIQPEQVNTFKVELHKEYLKNWIAENSIPLSFDEVWEIRERCIKKLSE